LNASTTATSVRNKNFIPLNDDQQQLVTASSSTASTATTVVEHTSELTETAQETTTTITRSISELMRNGNLAYCNECFVAVHKQMANTHVAINIFQQNETCLDVDDELNDQTREIAESSVNKPQEEGDGEEGAPEAEPKSEEIMISESLKVESHQNNEQLIKRIGEQLANLNKRCEQFNDVKQSIRQMNDLIKEDLYADVGSIAILLKKSSTS